MPAVHRLGDIGSGHGCYPPRPNAAASGNVFANSIGIHRQSDAWSSHCCVDCHTSILAAGSSTVYVNSLQCARIGDPVACGSVCATGSGNVFAGG